MTSVNAAVKALSNECRQQPTASLTMSVATGDDLEAIKPPAA